MRKVVSILGKPKECKLSTIWVIYGWKYYIYTNFQLLRQKWENSRSNHSISTSIYTLHNIFAEICCHLQVSLDLDNVPHVAIPKHFIHPEQNFSWWSNGFQGQSLLTELSDFYRSKKSKELKPKSWIGTVCCEHIQIKVLSRPEEAFEAICLLLMPIKTISVHCGVQSSPQS